MTDLKQAKSCKEADFIVINPGATTLQRLRQSSTLTVAEKLFALMTFGD